MKKIPITYEWEIKGLGVYRTWGDPNGIHDDGPDGHISPFWMKVYELAEWLHDLAMSKVSKHP